MYFNTKRFSSQNFCVSVEILLHKHKKINPVNILLNWEGMLKEKSSQKYAHLYSFWFKYLQKTLVRMPQPDLERQIEKKKTP